MMTNASEERRQRGVEDGWICVGAFVGSHGVRGDVRLKSFTDVPGAIFSYPSLHEGAGGPVVTLRLLRKGKDSFIVHMEGVGSREEAQALKGIGLYIPRDALQTEDEDEFYLADLIGLEARNEYGEKLGFVRAVENFGAEDLLELVLESSLKGLGRHAFIPFRKAYVPVVDVRSGYVEILFAEWEKTQTSERDTDDMQEAGT